MLTWIINLFKVWLTTKAEIHDKEQQEVGKEKQLVTQDEAALKDAYDSKQTEDKVLNEPSGVANDWLHKHHTD